MRRLASGLTLGAVAAAMLFAGPRPAQATLDMQKKAKELGITSVTNCQSCHVEKMPKKGDTKYNEMGQWLIDQKEKKGAKQIDIAWLKEYQPPKK